MAWSKERGGIAGNLKWCYSFPFGGRGSLWSSWLRGLSEMSSGTGTEMKLKGGRCELFFRGVCTSRLLAVACAILSMSYLGCCLGPSSLTEQETIVWGMLGTKATLLSVEAHGGWRDAWARWSFLRRSIIAPILQGLANMVAWLFVVQLADILVLCVGRALISLTGFRYRTLLSGGYGSFLTQKDVPAGEEASEGLLKGEGLAAKDAAGVEEQLPKVLVQIPMCNERECYQQSMATACGLDWPADRILIQVLDDSDDAEIRRLISEEVCEWQKRGFPIVYLHRLKRTGHKAGNLRYGMEMANGQKEFDFVAIFDADFMPTSDFLQRTVPHFRGHPDLALVQARWTFVNARENILTWLQDIAECYHFEIEQQVMSYMTLFFGFNGTAGVWRLSALEEGGGWEHRTTVEDMDMAVRAHLHGWRFIFLNHVETLCELPSTYASYCKQQHRWFAGPMQLFRLTFWQTLMAHNVALWKKANLLISFFWLRKLLLPVLTFLLFFVLLPASIIVPELQIPLWAALGVPVAISAIHCAAAVNVGLACVLALPNLLFENVMALTKAGAIAAGLLGTKSMGEWVVTQKSGSPPTLVRALTPLRNRNEIHATNCTAAVPPADTEPAGTTSKGGEKPSTITPPGPQANLASAHLHAKAGAEDSERLNAAMVSSTMKHDKHETYNINAALLNPPKGGNITLVDPSKGDGLKELDQESQKMKSRPHMSVHWRELFWGALLIGMATCSRVFLEGRHSWLLGLQGILLLATGTNLLER